MRLSDLARTAFGGLWQQKARTLLTLTGVIVGSCSLAFSLSLGVGLREMIDREFQKRDEFWWIRAYSPRRGTVKEDDSEIPTEKIAVEGAFSNSTRDRIRSARIEQYRNVTPPKNPKLITNELIEKIRAIPDVIDIRTTRQAYCRMTTNDRIEYGMMFSCPLDIFDPPLDTRIVAGRMPGKDDAMECVVSEFLLYRLGIRTDEAMAQMIGKVLRIEQGESEMQKSFSLANALGPNNPTEMVSQSQAEILNKIIKQFPEKIDSFDLHPLEKAAVKAVMSRQSDPKAPKPKVAKASLTIVGILRISTKDERSFEPLPAKIRDQNYDLIIPPLAGELFFGQLSDTIERGYPEVAVRCRPNGDLRGVVKGIEELGIEQFSTLKWYESAKLEVTLISVGLNVFSVVALFIAAIGITNTLVTTVLERTKEIGILKAVGAKDRDVTATFLAEGAAVGLIGGLFGVIIARLIAIPADKLVLDLVKKVSQQRMITDRVFEFPWWLMAGAVVFALTVTTFAAWYPARRAARIEPVEALRHE